MERSEKWGGGGRSNSQMTAFRQALENCELADLGYRSPKFTWSNSRDSLKFKKERLDRGVANSEWRGLFPEMEVVVETTLCSDHTPLILCLLGENVCRGQKRFRYEAFWQREEGYNEVLKHAWVSTTEFDFSWGDFEAILSRCQKNLVRWQRNRNGSLQENIVCLQRRLHALQGSEDVGVSEETKLVKRELEMLLEKSDLQWRQRAKTEWLRSGDQNTKSYHACANSRRKSNTIYAITDTEDRLCSSKDEVQLTFVNYFVGLFTSENAGSMVPCLEPISCRVTEDMNRSLLQPFTTEEVRAALFQMAPLKASGPDGFPAEFYQKNWSLMGTNICKAIIGSLNYGIMPDFLNLTNIVLIPKVKTLTCVIDYRPISLCNVSYKIISKLLANRLKKLLLDIISPVQSAFILGRLITDNVLAAYETLHTMHTHLKGKKGFMAVQLDMSKVYNRVEWKFLEAVMRRMGFAPRWIDLIMMYVITVQYAVVVNRKPCAHIKPQRGLRQGDPIFPYLFLICAEALSAMLTKANAEGVLTGVPTSKRRPRISYLFFADDSLLFCRSNLSQWDYLTNLLRTYEAASGQRLNNNKTSIFFSKNTSLEDRGAILEASRLPSAHSL